MRDGGEQQDADARPDLVRTTGEAASQAPPKHEISEGHRRAESKMMVVDTRQVIPGSLFSVDACRIALQSTRREDSAEDSVSAEPGTFAYHLFLKCLPWSL